MINSNGRVAGAYKDTCTNYQPDKSKPTGVRSVKFGMLFKCKNYDPASNRMERIGEICPDCKNKDYKIYAYGTI